MTLGLCLGLVTAVAVCAQPLSVYSEFARIDASGDVTAPETPREILSPALVRNGFTSFQVVVQAPAEARWWLYVGQNPENAVKVTMYRESGETLEPAPEPIDLPRHGSGTEILWMDVWTPSDARVDRIKIEPELHLDQSADDDWVIYPIEARTVEARVPAPALPIGSYLCPLVTSPAVATARLHLRNAAQDFALASRLPEQELARLLTFCDAPAPASWSEGYLRIRDYLIGLR
jgi:hypothetical protein